MVVNKLAELVSSVATCLSPAKASVISYKSPGLPPIHQSKSDTFSVTENNNNFRLAASLQNFSAFQQIDREGDPNPDLERSLGHKLPPILLKQENVVSSFSKEKGSPIYSGRSKWVRVSCLLLGLSLFACLCFTLVIFCLNWFRGPSKYFVVLDCGSTGTRVYVYQASVNHKKDNNLPILLKSLPEGFQWKSGRQSGRAYNRMETEPGFDNLVRNTSGLKKAIKPLIKWAATQVPKGSHKSTALFLYATAGVRRLPSSDSRWLLDSAWSILKESPFLCKKEWVKTITGGSSLQVTFEGKLHGRDETSLKLSIGPVNHHLSAYSLAGYGLNDAFDRSVAHLLKMLPKVANADLVHGKVEIEHPCLQSGYKEQYLCSECASIRLKDGKRPIIRKRVGKGRKSGVPIRLIGSPKWEECSALAKVAVNLSEWSDHSTGIDCELQPCALADNLPRPVGQFYAMSGFYVVYRFFNLTSDAALDDLLDHGREFCGKPWDVAKKSVAPQPFIEQYCFRAPYVVRLLREGLHINDHHVNIGSGSISWTLGVALFEAGKVFPYGGKNHSYQILRVKTHSFILFAVLFTSLFVLYIAFSWVNTSWLPKFFRRPYLPILRHNSATSTSMLNIPAPFRFQGWSPVSAGDGRIKMPLSPTVSSTQQRPFGPGFGFGNGAFQFAESRFFSSSSSASHSYSSGSLGHMQLDHSFWTPHRSQQRLQSRRSQSREDLNSSIGDAMCPRMHT
ncbi:probable apyrase 7 isoform X2 [Andrographis paniculata]|uniref:probable apyrase 7 isoform X2 n=1 Tax=Andrographis paniculata TaxID=175694 RepID=UPI0021E92FDF|nr:probable apyrase 7 isoform X2 [Andrographis paniculata]